MIADLDDIDGLSESFKKLRTAYEKYFMGIERVEPVKERDAFKKRLQRLVSPPPRNTAKRFRLQNLQASVVTHEHHWNRIARQIEEGTYKRDRWRAEKLILERGQPTAASPQEQEQEQAPATPPTSDTGAAAENGPGGGSAAADERFLAAVRQLHAVFERTRVQLGASTKPVSLQAMAATVRAQTSAIKARHGCKTVEFRVAVKEGRPILKAIPRQ